MNKKQRLQSTICAFKWVYWLKILGLFILFTTPFLLIFLSPRAVHSEAIFSVDGGLGDFQIKTKETKDAQFQSDSKNSRRHVSLGLDLEKEGYPLRVSLQWNLFTTEEEPEKWTIGPMHENRLNIQGETYGVQAFVTPYTYSSGKNRIRVKPFFGGGLGYKRFKFERKGLNEKIFIPPINGQYFLGNQAITAIGVTPYIGFFLDLPKFEVEFSLSLGWSFLAAESNLDYHDFSGDGEVYPRNIHTSGSAFVTGIEIVKSWESFSIALAYIWEKTQIDDKLLVEVTEFEGEPDTYKYFYFPEFQIAQTFAQMSLNYLF